MEPVKQSCCDLGDENIFYVERDDSFSLKLNDYGNYYITHCPFCGKEIELAEPLLHEYFDVLKNLLNYLYKRHPRGESLKKCKDAELINRMKQIGSTVFDAQPILDARRILRRSKQ